ncbi:hypothetical protein V1511DRAFT_504106 [Dipodascopsis uninucleata]
MSKYYDEDDQAGPSDRKKTSDREIFIGGVDSAYEGSVAADSEGVVGTRPPSMPRVLSGSGDRAMDRLLNMEVQQVQYNQNCVSLGRAISGVMSILKELQLMNREWPAQYPAIRRVEAADSRVPLRRSYTEPQRSSEPFANDVESILTANAMPSNGKSKAGSDNIASDAEMKTSENDISTKEVPRLLDYETSHEFNVLKLDLKLGAVTPAELVESLEKGAIASLLDGKVMQALRHLTALRERIEDKSSKVLVTGDLNAGKSTFCNALLRRDVLPEDQQPCTEVFCEVLDVRLNDGIEEVHAIPHGSTYDRHDERTYDVFPLKELERLAVSSEVYALLKIYVEDKRSPEESLLRNGVVDIALIDAPGLNMDSMQTTAVFARQEEIDVVVFVVSAENHFTLSAKEFIWNAAHEKAFIFIVVNRFDNIRDKKRCTRLILDQVSKLSPQTYDDSSNLVHFVSSNKVPMMPDGDDGSDDSDNDGDDNGNAGEGSSNPNNKAPNNSNNNDNRNGPQENETDSDFERLERCLRNFVLERRSLSKLAPAKTYLLNVLGDVEALALYNEAVSSEELKRLREELEEITPKYEDTLMKSVKIMDDVEVQIERLVTTVYEHVKYKLEVLIGEIGGRTYVEYPGLFQVYSYAADTRDAMLQSIQHGVLECEEFARKKTTTGFNVLKNLGLQQFAGTGFYVEKMFNNSLMFSRRRDVLARGSVSTQITISDYIDIFGTLGLGPSQLAGSSRTALNSTGLGNGHGNGMSLTPAGLNTSKLSYTGGVSLFTLATVVVPKALGLQGNISWLVKLSSAIDLKRWIMPAVGLAAALGIMYVVSEISNVVPRNLALKLKQELAELDYVHLNAERISSECRKVLRYPAEDLRRAFQHLLDEQAAIKTERTKQAFQADNAYQYFSKLDREAKSIIASVNRIDLIEYEHEHNDGQD